MKNTIILAICACVTTAVAGNTCPLTTSKSCGTPAQQGLSSAEKDELLRAHNELRNSLAQGLETRGLPGPQPPAANMRRMHWDGELATLAQSWANQCVFSHNMCGGSTRFPVGQNLFATIANKHQKVNMTKVVWSWYKEVQRFNNSAVYPFNYAANTGHFTQVVWADTHLVGCGLMAHTHALTGEAWHVVVCNYGPAGNFLRSTMYQVGERCSACSGNLTCDATYTSLCS